MDLVDTVHLTAGPGVLPGRMDVVFIEDFVGQTIIGIDSSEQHIPQTVRMNLAIGVPSLRACTTDRIEDTVNYAAVRDALHALLASHRVRRLCQLTESETARRQIRLLVRKQSTDFGRVRRSRAMQRTELRVVCDRVKHAADAA